MKKRSTKRATINKCKALQRAVERFVAERGGDMTFHCYVFKPTGNYFTTRSGFVAIVRPLA